MKCEFCSAKLKKGQTVCPECGKELTATEKAEAKKEKTKKNSKGLKIGLAVAGLVLLAAILTIAVLHFTGVINVGKWFSEQDIFYKASYTAQNTKVERNGKKVIARIGDQELTNSELQIHYWTTVQEFVQYYGGYVKYLTGMDPNVALDEQVYDQTTGKTYQQWFLEKALENWSRFAILAQMADDASYQMTPEQQNEMDTIPETIKQQALEAGYTDVEAYVDKHYPGSSFEGFVSYNKLVMKAMFYFDVLYESLTPTYQEMEAYYAQNEASYKQNKVAKEDGLYHNIRQIYIPVVGDIGDIQGKPTYTQKEWDECLPKAQRVLQDFQESGGTEEKFIQFVDEVCYTPYKSNGGLMEKLTKHTEIPTQLEESYAAALKDWYLSPDRKPGDVGMVKDDEGEIQGYQILYYCSGTAIWEDRTKTAVLAERTNAMLADAENKWPVDIKYSRIVLGQVENTEATQPSQ